MAFEVVSFVRMFTDDEKIPSAERFECSDARCTEGGGGKVCGGGFVIFHHIRRGTPVLSLPGPGDSWHHLHSEQIEEVNFHKCTIMFTILREGKRTRLFL